MKKKRKTTKIIHDDDASRFWTVNNIMGGCWRLRRRKEMMNLVREICKLMVKKLKIVYFILLGLLPSLFFSAGYFS